MLNILTKVVKIPWAAIEGLASLLISVAKAICDLFSKDKNDSSNLNLF